LWLSLLGLLRNMRLYYPHKPFYTTQSWGNLNPAYSNHFGDPNFKRHNGIDSSTIAGGEYGRKWPLYCPVEGFRVTSVGNYPEGGGNQLELLSKDMHVIGGVQCYVRLLFCHGHRVLVKVGHEPQIGEILMIANNTGFSTGPHTHLGMYRLNKQFKKLDTNEATGSYDPALFFSGEFAIDKATIGTLIKSGLRYYQYLLTGK
jgi:murein DD-endopeptidase MepM/ murein hydrolase activator NlpD